MEETKTTINSRNNKENLILQNHKSVVFNQINSTKIVPHLLKLNNKNEDIPENKKGLVNLRTQKTLKNSSKIINVNNVKKMPIIHSYSIKSPDYLNKLIKNNNKNLEEGFKLNESSNYNLGKNNDYSSNKINKGIISLINTYKTPQNKMLPKRMNSINVNFINRNILNNNNLNSLKYSESKKELNLLNTSNKKSFNFKNFERKNTTYRAPFGNEKNNVYLKTFYAKKLKKKPQKIINHLQILEEDKIFEEMKNYLCYKYETKRLNTYDNRKIKEEQKLSKIGSEFKIKKIKPKLKTADKRRLNYLYLATNKVSNKIYIIKRKKLKNDLITYQKNLLETVKPSLSDYSYIYLRDKLFDIRKIDNKKYQNNYRKLKEIETEEKDIINQFNETCEKCTRQFKKVKQEKDILININLDIKLPTMDFISCLKKYKNNNEKYKKKNKTKTKNIKKK